MEKELKKEFKTPAKKGLAKPKPLIKSLAALADWQRERRKANSIASASE